MNKYKAIRLLTCLFVFAGTILISPFYVLADQALYIRAYDVLRGQSFIEGFIVYSQIIGATEVVHYTITWIASNLDLEKNFVMALSNALLAYYSMLLLRKWGASIFVECTIVVTNFYILLMYFGVERLKFGFLFLALSLLFVGQRKRFHFFCFMAVLAHFQVLLVYGSMLFKSFILAIIDFVKSFRISPKKLIYSFFLLAPLAFIASNILVKLQYYASDVADSKNIFDMVRIILLMLMSLWYSKNKSETVLFFIPVILAVSVVGSDRVNMMGYFIFLYYGLQYNRGLNVGVIATNVYFAYKSYGFISDIIEYGDGFATILGRI